jgi:excisionase family DNA binding protein
MNLSLYCTVAEAAKLANVTEPYVRILLANGRLTGEKIGKEWLVLKSDALAFQRQPGMGRPKRSKPRRKK